MKLTADYVGFIYAHRGWLRTTDRPLPDEALQDCVDFDPTQPPRLGTRVFLMEQNMIARYLGRAFGQHRFWPIYSRLRIQGFRLKPYLAVSNG